MECNHEKVYASFSYASNPPQTPWICKKCGHRGIDRQYRQPEDTYEGLLRKFGPLKEGKQE